MALMVVLLSGGCGILQKSPREESGGILFWSIGVIILSWPVVILLTMLGRRLNLVRNRVLLLQYKVYLLIQVIISLSIWLLSADSNFRGDFSVIGIIIGIIIAIVIIQVFTLLYLLLTGGLLILVLPVRLLAWVPSFLLVPYYLLFGLYYVTNEYVILHPLFLWTNWDVAIPFGVVILVGLLIRRIIEDDSLKRRYKILVDYFKKRGGS
jgi:hypothetical protein